MKDKKGCTRTLILLPLLSLLVLLYPQSKHRITLSTRDKQLKWMLGSPSKMPAVSPPSCHHGSLSTPVEGAHQIVVV